MNNCVRSLAVNTPTAVLAYVNKLVRDTSQTVHKCWSQQTTMHRYQISKHVSIAYRPLAAQLCILSNQVHASV